MKKNVTLIDYGMGNLRSVSKALETLGADVKITGDPKDVSSSERLVLPGVGAIFDVMENLRKNRLIEPLLEYLKSDRLFLGICLGYQVLFERSEENNGVPGFGFLKGRFRYLKKAREQGLKVPHMGWNSVSFKPDCPLFKGIKPGSHFYFVHSFYPDPTEPGDACAWTEYGFEFPCAIWKGNCFATQFHPEKSQAVGLQLLENFLAI